jgi:hypothetical protein
MPATGGKMRICLVHSANGFERRVGEAQLRAGAGIAHIEIACLGIAA